MAGPAPPPNPHGHGSSGVDCVLSVEDGILGTVNRTLDLLQPESATPASKPHPSKAAQATAWYSQRVVPGLEPLLVIRIPHKR